MKYLICQDWNNTSGNHAGMKHMCNLLKEHYPEEYEVIVFPQILYPASSLNIKTKSVLYSIYYKFLSILFIPYLYKNAARQLTKKLTANDSVYFLEYCEKILPIYTSAEYIKKHSSQTKVYGMVHLIPKKLNADFTIPKMKKWIEPIDSVLTLGSSLTNFLTNRYLLSDKKIKTLFHYVDLNYYQALNDEKENSCEPRILVQGNQARNIDLLEKVIRVNLNVQFTICQGVLDLREKFKNCPNVRLVGFMKEADLLSLMQHSDISLNVMDDTIGSNVIVTSMAVGLAMVVSDVGSIRDYCKEDGAIYCDNNPESFSNAIKELLSDKQKLTILKQKSLEYSRLLSIQELHNSL